MPDLVITQPGGSVTRRRITDEPIVVGRDAACDLPLDDLGASRRHARFSRTPHGIQIEDLKSKNGTLVNDGACQTRLLRDGDQIIIGSTLIVFHDATGASASQVTVAEDDTMTHATRYVSRDRELNLSRQRLKMIYDLSERLTTLQGRDQLLEDALTICFETLQFQRGAIAVRKPNARTLDWPVVRNLRGPAGELTISRTLLSRALEHGERAIFTEGDSKNNDPTVSMVQHGIRSAMCVPLAHGEETLGIIYGDRVHSSVVYTEEDSDFFAAIARQVSIGLINCRLVEEQQRMIRLNHDIDMARKIQTGLFPARFPSHDALKIAALNEPGMRVSGDYYDVMELPDGRVWCLIADVTGEGMSAALLMANLQAAVRVTIDESDDPGVLLARWNRLICHNTDGSRFVTALLALVDPKSGEVRFATAGHFPPMILRAGEARPTEPAADPGFPLGVMAEGEFPTSRFCVDEGRFLLFTYTDGVVEASNAAGENFGGARLMDTLAEQPNAAPAAMVKHVRKQVTQFTGGGEPGDDITMLAVQVR